MTATDSPLRLSMSHLELVGHDRLVGSRSCPSTPSAGSQRSVANHLMSLLSNPVCHHLSCTSNSLCSRMDYSGPGPSMLLYSPIVILLQGRLSPCITIVWYIIVSCHDSVFTYTDNTAFEERFICVIGNI